MQINIAGQHVSVGQAFEDYAAEKMEDIRQYFDQLHDVNITLSHERHLNKIEVALHVSGLHLHAEGDGDDWYPAMDRAVEKLIKQLKKYKGRMKKHQDRRAKLSDMPLAPISAASKQIDETSLDEAPDDFFADFLPKIIHQEIKSLQPMTVDEAVMQMDLLHTNVFMFQNPKTGALNVVYRPREDAAIHWIEPTQEAAEATA